MVASLRVILTGSFQIERAVNFSTALIQLVNKTPFLFVGLRLAFSQQSQCAQTKQAKRSRLRYTLSVD